MMQRANGNGVARGELGTQRGCFCGFAADKLLSLRQLRTVTTPANLSRIPRKRHDRVTGAFEIRSELYVETAGSAT